MPSRNIHSEQGHSPMRGAVRIQGVKHLWLLFAAPSYSLSKTSKDSASRRVRPRRFHGLLMTPNARQQTIPSRNRFPGDQQAGSVQPASYVVRLRYAIPPCRSRQDFNCPISTPSCGRTYEPLSCSWFKGTTQSGHRYGFRLSRTIKSVRSRAHAGSCMAKANCAAR